MHRLICFGDSITASINVPECHAWPAHLSLTLQRASAHEWEVYKRGVPGNTTWQGLDRFETDIAPLLPAYVLIQYGFNDASIPVGRLLQRCEPHAFENNVSEIIRMIREAHGTPILLNNHIIQDTSLQGNGRAYLENYSIYPPIIRRLAKKTETPLIDLEEIMKDVDPAEFLCEDRLHLSTSGNAIYASFVYSALKAILSLN